MRLVLIESPYAGDVAYNLAYGRACVADCLARGEAAFASHLLYTQEGVLDDSDPAERKLGMRAGFAFGSKCDATVVYIDLGQSPGMLAGVRDAQMNGRPIEYRRLGRLPVRAGLPGCCSECGRRLMPTPAPRCIRCPPPM